MANTNLAVRTVSPVSRASAMPSGTIAAIAHQSTRLSQLHALACTCKHWSRVIGTVKRPLRSIATAQPSTLQEEIGKSPFPLRATPLMAFQYLCSRLRSHAGEEEPSEIVAFTRGFVHLLDSLPETERCNAVMKMHASFRGLSGKDFERLFRLLPEKDDYCRKRLVQFALCLYWRPIEFLYWNDSSICYRYKDGARLFFDDAECAEATKKSFAESILPSDVAQYVKDALAEKDEIWIITLAKAITWKQAQGMVPRLQAFLNATIPPQHLLTCLKSVFIDETAYTMTLSHLLRLPQDEWPEGLSDLLATRISGRNPPIVDREEQLLHQWETLITELTNSPSILLKLAKDDMRALKLCVVYADSMKDSKPMQKFVQAVKASGAFTAAEWKSWRKH